MKRTIKIGSRDSVLAIKQAEIVMESVKTDYPNITFQHLKFKTTGDLILDRNLDEVGGKGLFTKEIEQALLNVEIDIAVHSYKDMPYEEGDQLPIVALSKREEPYDALVLPPGQLEIDPTKQIGSSSARRSIQFNKLYNGFTIKPIRGNVPTRLSKLDSGEYSALILAQAGLIRLSMQHRISRIFTADEMIPSASQGIMAVQARKGEDHSYLGGFHNIESEIVSRAERQFLMTIGGGCTSPVAVFGQISGNEILLRGMYADEMGNAEFGKVTGSIEDATALGEELALSLVRRYSA